MALLVPGILFGLAFLFALYLAFSPLMDWWPHNHPTPNERRQSREAQEQSDEQARIMAYRQAVREKESHHWQFAARHGVLGGRSVACLELHRPDKSDPDEFDGATAICQVRHDGRIFRPRTPANYNVGMTYSFVFIFPNHFEDSEDSSQPSFDFPRGCYPVFWMTWKSEVLTAERTYAFRLDYLGRPEKL